MKINTLNKATKLLSEIHGLDEQIIKLDKIAMKCAESTSKNTLSLTIEKPKDKKAELDTDGYDLTQGSLYKSLMGGLWSIDRHNDTKSDSEDFEVDEVETMIICGALIQIKKDKRKILINQLLELGYTY